jgi:hypothetical protein
LRRYHKPPHEDLKKKTQFRNSSWLRPLSSTADLNVTENLVDFWIKEPRFDAAADGEIPREKKKVLTVTIDLGHSQLL